MMYREFYSQEEWDRIVAADREEGMFPHCNQETFHVPGTCPFCDGYYRRNPDFVPASCEAAISNGWGGNMAPKLDDMRAAEEKAEWDAWMDKMLNLGPVGMREEERESVRQRVKDIVAKFTKGKVQ